MCHDLPQLSQVASKLLNSFSKYDVHKFGNKQVYRRQYESRRSSKPKLHLKEQQKNKIWRKTIFNKAGEILKPAMWHDHDNDFARRLHPAMWHVAGESWQWIHQMEAPCNLACGSRITCYWICPVAAPCNVVGGSGMICHWIRPNVRNIGILHQVLISTISLQSTCHSAPVFQILSKSDHHWQKKWCHLDFQDGGSGCRNGFFEKPMYDFL